MASVYAIANRKGGVGKTVTCAALAAAFSEKGKRTLAIDCDPQGNLTTALGLDPNSFEITLYNVMIQPEEFALATAIVATEVSGVDLVPANSHLAGAEAQLVGELGWDRTLSEILEPHRSAYDFILLDCPPSLGVLTVNALMTADTVIVPVQTSYLAMQGLQELHRIIAKVRKLNNRQLAVRILRTMHTSRTLHSNEVLEAIGKAYGPEVFETVVKRTIRFDDATAAGKPILLYDTRSEAAEAYRRLAEEILNGQTA